MIASVFLKFIFIYFLFYRKSENIQYAQIFDCHGSNEDYQRIIVFGDPGMGKTTLSYKMVYDWATDEPYCAQFELVFVVEARNIKGNVMDEIFSNLLPNNGRFIQPDFKQNIVDFINENEKKCLFIIDGMDELNEKKLKSTDLKLLMEWNMFRHCWVLITTRPYTAHKLREVNITKTIQIDGFMVQNAVNYVVDFFISMSQKESDQIGESDTQSKCQMLIERLKHDKHIQNLCTNPHNTALIAMAFYYGYITETQISAIETKLQLVDNVLEGLKKRFCSRTDTHGPNTKEYISELESIIKKIAFLGMEKEEYRFSVGAIHEQLGVQKCRINDVVHFGVITKDLSIFKHPHEEVLNFCHRSIQDYYAACHIVDMSESKMVDFFAVDETSENIKLSCLNTICDAVELICRKSCKCISDKDHTPECCTKQVKYSKAFWQLIEIIPQCCRKLWKSSDSSGITQNVVYPPVSGGQTTDITKINNDAFQKLFLPCFRIVRQSLSPKSILYLTFKDLAVESTKQRFKANQMPILETVQCFLSQRSPHQLRTEYQEHALKAWATAMPHHLTLTPKFLKQVTGSMNCEIAEMDEIFVLIKNESCSCTQLTVNVPGSPDLNRIQSLFQCIDTCQQYHEMDCKPCLKIIQLKTTGNQLKNLLDQLISSLFKGKVSYWFIRELLKKTLTEDDTLITVNIDILAKKVDVGSTETTQCFNRPMLRSSFVRAEP